MIPKHFHTQLNFPINHYHIELASLSTILSIKKLVTNTAKVRIPNNNNKL